MSWNHPALYIAESTAGIGVFTRESLKKDTVVARFGGFIMTIGEEQSLPAAIRDTPLQIDDDFVIGPRTTTQTCVADYFNHSCSPSLGFKDAMSLSTIRRVMKGSELTFDYAMSISGHEYEMLCACGARNCRHLITADDWKLPRLQRKYAGFFQPYIERKIAPSAKRQENKTRSFALKKACWQLFGTSHPRHSRRRRNATRSTWGRP